MISGMKCGRGQSLFVVDPSDSNRLDADATGIWKLLLGRTKCAYQSACAGLRVYRRNGGVSVLRFDRPGRGSRAGIDGRRSPNTVPRIQPPRYRENHYKRCVQFSTIGAQREASVKQHVLILHSLLKRSANPPAKFPIIRTD